MLGKLTQSQQKARNTCWRPHPETEDVPGKMLGDGPDLAFIHIYRCYTGRPGPLIMRCFVTSALDTCAVIILPPDIALLGFIAFYAFLLFFMIVKCKTSGPPPLLLHSYSLAWPS